eukprot:jgi/Botrbrau1/6246/Bobra.0129s0001.2
MEDAHALEVSEVLQHFGEDPSKGLSDEQVLEQRAIYGPNELVPDKGTPFWKLVLKQFDDLLVKILIVAAVVDLVIAIINGETGASVFVEPGVIVLILIANATVGVITETNAEKAIEELKAYEADAATVLRNGRLSVLPASELVPGDIVEVSVGGKVPADLRVIELLSSTLRADQSILTGESGSAAKSTAAVPSRKAVYQDKHCILFSGTVITVGRARAVVTGTGPSTAIGKIRDAMVEAPEDVTPLKQKLDEFGTFLSKVIAMICILVWVINIPRFNDPLHGGWVQGSIFYFKIAVALAVAAIPEGLPAVVTTCLALGSRKMAKRNAIVRSLPSVETLGCTTVICSDKTGTLTTNQMSVVRLAVLRSAAQGLADFTVTGTTFTPEGEIVEEGGRVVEHPGDHSCLLRMAMCSALCNDSIVVYAADKEAYQKVGEATEVALRMLAEKIGLQGFDRMPSALSQLSRQDRATFCNDYWNQEYRKVSTLEFERDRKMMSVLTRRDGQCVLWVKGAPEAVIARCSKVHCDDGGDSAPLTDRIAADFLEKVTQLGGGQALRCLALAYRDLPPGHLMASPDDEQGLTLLGVVGMHDPPRAEVHAAIQTCRGAGIRVIVVTGDNKATAEAICRQVGLLDSVYDALPGLHSLSGIEFDELEPEGKASAVQSVKVLSRVEPTHKSELIALLKAQDEVVAMTGDGVNDAPALKRADIGIGMGSGTAVARHAADMVLADDNFATIVTAVAEGRAIYANTKQFIRYMVSSNIGEVVAIFFAALLGMPEVLNPVQLLWVNLVTDGLPATALGANPPDKDIMTARPRRVQEGIVNTWLFIRYLVIGLYVGCVTVAGFAWWYMFFPGGPKLTWSQLTRSASCSGDLCAVFKDRSPTTVSMSVLVVVEMFNALNALSENNSLLQLPPWSNLWLLAAIALSMVLHMLILYIPPAAALFTVAPLGASEWRMVLLLSFPVILLDEVLKFISRNVVSRWRGNGVMGGFTSRFPAALRRVAKDADLLPSSRSGYVFHSA